MGFFKKINCFVQWATTAVVFVLLVTRVSSAELDSNNSNEDSKLGIKSSKAIIEVGVNELDEDKSFEGKRHPKLGFNLPISGIPGLTTSTITTIRPDGLGGQGGTGVSGDSQNDAGNNFGSSGLGLASTAVLIKSGVLGGLTAIKAAIIPPLFIGSIIIFLIAGAVFFTCNVINCGIGSGSGGGFGPGLGGLPSLNNLFNRNGYDYYEQQVQPVYQALEDGYKKFE